jgi:hypothetical protein
MCGILCVSYVVSALQHGRLRVPHSQASDPASTGWYRQYHRPMLSFSMYVTSQYTHFRDSIHVLTRDSSLHVNPWSIKPPREFSFCMANVLYRTRFPCATSVAYFFLYVSVKKCNTKKTSDAMTIRFYYSHVWKLRGRLFVVGKAFVPLPCVFLLMVCRHQAQCRIFDPHPIP